MKPNEFYPSGDPGVSVLISETEYKRLKNIDDNLKEMHSKIPRIIVTNIIRSIDEEGWDDKREQTISFKTENEGLEYIATQINVIETAANLEFRRQREELEKIHTQNVKEKAELYEKRQLLRILKQNFENRIDELFKKKWLVRMFFNRKHFEIR